MDRVDADCGLTGGENELGRDLIYSDLVPVWLNYAQTLAIV